MRIEERIPGRTGHGYPRGTGYGYATELRGIRVDKITGFEFQQANKAQDTSDKGCRKDFRRPLEATAMVLTALVCVKELNTRS